MTVATIIVSLLLATLLTLSAVIKLTGQEPFVQGYLRVGVPEAKLKYLAIILLAGAAGLILGLLWAPIGVAAAIGVTCYFIVAVAFHIRANDTKNLPTPLVFAAIAAVVLALQLATLAQDSSQGLRPVRATLPLSNSPMSVGEPVEPRLSDAEIGHLRHFVALARRDLDDWRGWEAENQFDMEAYRYQIAFIGYTLALQQYHSVPAWREVHRDTLARLIRRMTQKPVWEYWETVSRGSPEHDPDFDGARPGWRDPVREKNVMYTGHLAHLAALYEMLYRDFRWDEPGAFTLRWDAVESYAYDLPAVVRRLRDQMATNPWGGIECEINAVFPECNNHAILAMKLYDDAHGTRYFAVRHRFRELFDRAPMIDPETHEVVAFYRVKQGDVLSNRNPRVGFPRDLLVWPMIKLGLMSFDSPSACGWTGAFLHAWEPQLVEQHYPLQKAHHVRAIAAAGQLAPGGDLAEELSVGYFATLAVEMGDVETARGLLAWADEEYDPVLQDGQLRYPQRRDGKHRTHNLTGKLIGMARANRPNGLWRLHNEPWRDADFAHPLLEAVKFPEVLVRQAFWDPSAARLVATLEPGAGPVETTFRIVRIDATTPWELHRDGILLAQVDGRRASGSSDVRIVAPGTLEITTSLAAPQRIDLHRVPLSPNRPRTGEDDLPPSIGGSDPPNSERPKHRRQGK